MGSLPEHQAVGQEKGAQLAFAWADVPAPPPRRRRRPTRHAAPVQLALVLGASLVAQAIPALAFSADWDAEVARVGASLAPALVATGPPSCAPVGAAGRRGPVEPTPAATPPADTLPTLHSNPEPVAVVPSRSRQRPAGVAGGWTRRTLPVAARRAHARSGEVVDAFVVDGDGFRLIPVSGAIAAAPPPPPADDEPFDTSLEARLALMARVAARVALSSGGAAPLPRGAAGAPTPPILDTSANNSSKRRNERGNRRLDGVRWRSWRGTAHDFHADMSEGLRRGADADSFRGVPQVRGAKAAALADRVEGCGFDFFYLTHECKGEPQDALDEDSVRTATCMLRTCARYARQRAAVLRENLGASLRTREKRRVKGERATFVTLTIPTPATWRGTDADFWPYVDRLRDSFKLLHEGWRHVWTWLQACGIDWAYRSTECGCGGNPHLHAIVYGKRPDARALRRRWTKWMGKRGVTPTGGAKELWVHVKRVTRRGRGAGAPGARPRGYSAEGAIAELAKYLVKACAREEGREYTQIDPLLAAFVALASSGLRMQQGYGDARGVKDRVVDEKEKRTCGRCNESGGKWHMNTMPREDWPAFVALARREGRAFSRKRDPPSSRAPPTREPGEEG